jgi:hypothetical protein
MLQGQTYGELSDQDVALRQGDTERTESTTARATKRRAAQRARIVRDRADSP